MKKRIRKFLNLHPRLKSILRPFYRHFVKFPPASETTGIPLEAQPFISDKRVIYFDITSYSVTDVKTGIQRVVRNFLECINETVHDGYEVICISGLNGYHIIEQKGFYPRNDLVIKPKAGDIYLSIDSNPVQPYEYWNTLKSWQQDGCKIIGCVYDLVYIKYPQYVADENAVTLLSRWLWHAAHNYDGLICISKTVENELNHWISENNIHNPKLKTGYFHLGGDFRNITTLMKNSTTAFFQQFYTNNKLTFLAVATIEPRKGYIDLIEAFEQLAATHTGAILLIVGRIGWKYQETVERITGSKYYNKSIFWFSDCEDNVLEILYQISDCYISGSYYEGFGLGIIEASSKGLPVLLRDIPVNREVSENKGLYYKDIAHLVEIIKKISANRDALSQQKRISSLTWRESVNMAWNSMQKMI